jgi:hypothetical protein
MQHNKIAPNEGLTSFNNAIGVWGKFEHDLTFERQQSGNQNDCDDGCRVPVVELREAQS